MMDKIPATGPNPAKSKFFGECASAFQFLALFHALPLKAQEELMTGVQRMASALYEKPK